MSIIKRAFFPGEHNGGLLVQQVEPGELVKTSSALAPGVQDFIGCLRPDPRYTYVLANAMGYSQYFGANSNTDWYGYNEHLCFDGLLHHWPDIGQNIEADRAKGKGWPYGYPCFYGAACYAHHKNTDPQRLGFGDVIYVGTNSHMKRVELVMRVFNEEAVKKGHTSILERIRAKERVDVSMGCKVPFDLCSICTDWDKIKTAWKTYDPKKHRHPGIAILAYHKKVSPIRGLAITRKDYCFPAGTLIQMASGEQRPIEEVRVGDEVITHTGQARKVLHLLPREGVHAEAVRVRTWGMQDQIATANHPYRVFREMRTGVSGGRAAQMDQAEPQWVPAEELVSSDVVLRPIPALGFGEASTDLGWLLGMYIAEGSPNYSQGCAWPKSVTLTLHKNEKPLALRLWSAALELDEDTSYSVYEYPDREAIDVRINSRVVAEWLTRMGGVGSRTKVMGPGVFSQGEAFARGVLSGWADGDGSYGKAGLRIATSSERLAMQGQDLAARLGVLCAIQRYDRVSNLGAQTIWYLGFSGDAADAVKELRPQKSFSKQSKLFFWRGNLCTSVRGVEPVKGIPDVFNFEVEEDNSYIAGGLAVHNCEHMRTQKGQILPDGRKVFVYNDFPRFFDISFVWIGADRTARVMWHLSEGGLPTTPRRSTGTSGLLQTLVRQLVSGKTSSMEKEIPDGIAQAVHSDADAMPELDVTIIEATSKKPLESLSALAGLGIVLTPQEFQRMVLPVPMKSVFDTNVSDVDDTYAVNARHFDHKLASAFAPLMEGRSAFAPYQNERLLAPTKVAEKKQAQVVRSPLMDKLAAQYNGYRLSVMENAPDLFPKAASHLTDDLVAQDKIANAALPALLLGAGPVVHLISSHLNRREAAGKELGTLSKVVADHPSFTSLATIGGILRAAMKVDKAGGLAQAAQSVVKVIDKVI
jgi:hypothetical protein